jgi:hypothetical protein
MKIPHHQKHPEFPLAVRWITALLTGKALPDLSRPAKTSRTKGGVHA